jgi:hypothetical protein
MPFGLPPRTPGISLAIWFFWRWPVRLSSRTSHFSRPDLRISRQFEDVPMGPGRNGREITNPIRMHATSWLSKCLRSVSDRGMRTALGRLRWVHELLPAQSTLLHRFDQQGHVVIAPYHPDRIIPKASSFRSWQVLSIAYAQSRDEWLKGSWISGAIYGSMPLSISAPWEGPWPPKTMLSASKSLGWQARYCLNAHGFSYGAQFYPSTNPYADIDKDYWSHVLRPSITDLLHYIYRAHTVQLHGSCPPPVHSTKAYDIVYTSSPIHHDLSRDTDSNQRAPLEFALSRTNHSIVHDYLRHYIYFTFFS